MEEIILFIFVLGKNKYVSGNKYPSKSFNLFKFLISSYVSNLLVHIFHPNFKKKHFNLHFHLHNFTFFPKKNKKLKRISRKEFEKAINSEEIANFYVDNFVKKGALFYKFTKTSDIFLHLKNKSYNSFVSIIFFICIYKYYCRKNVI